MCMSQRRARIYRFNDSILIYSNQKLRTRYRFGRASIEYNALQFYASGGLLQVVGDTTGVHKSTISLAVHSGCHIGNNHSAYSREIALWDTNCWLARQYNLLLTECEGRTGEYWPEVVAVRTERSEVRTKTTEGQYSPVRLELARLVSSLLYGTRTMLVLSLPAFESKKNMQLMTVETVRMAKSRPRKNQSERSDLPCHIIKVVFTPSQFLRLANPVFDVLIDD